MEFKEATEQLSRQKQHVEQLLQCVREDIKRVEELNRVRLLALSRLSSRYLSILPLEVLNANAQEFL
jgi:hypothetical protein